MKIKNVKKYEVGTGEITKEYAEKTFQELLAFQGYGFCLGYDAKVEVKDKGLICIGQLKGNEFIKAPCLGEDYKWVKVINIIPMGYKEVCKITLFNKKEIICTKDHKFLCSDSKKHSINEIIKNNFGMESNESLWIYCEDGYSYIISCEDFDEKMPVMDIAVDSDEHLFYANGMAVSNCKAHATSYSVYSAVQMWLQEHYFLEYMCALLSHIKRDKEKKGVGVLNERVEYCIKHGTTISYPDVNESDADKWKIKAGGLIAPLKNIKGFTDKDTSLIISNRPYKDLKDFLDKTKINNKKFETLLFARAFDKWGTIDFQYDWYYNNYFEKEKKVKKIKKNLNEDLFSEFGFDEDNKEESSASPISVSSFTKEELEEKCLDLNGFIINDNIIAQYYYVYEKHVGDFQPNAEGNIAKSRIRAIGEAKNLKDRKDTSKPVWVLAQIKTILKNLRKKDGSLFSKILLSDGDDSIWICFWNNVVPNCIKRGNIMLLPLDVKYDEERKENKVSFCKWLRERVDIPVLYEEK